MRTKYTLDDLGPARINRVPQRFVHLLLGWDKLLSKIRSLFIQRFTFSSGIVHVDKQVNWKYKRDFIWIYPNSGLKFKYERFSRTGGPKYS